MNIFAKASVITVILGGSAVASASEVFDFSYMFTDGQQLTGSLLGVSSDGGQTVTNISNMQASLNGIAFAGGAGPLQVNAWNTSAESFDDTTPVVISANAAQNNFVISDVDAAVNTSPDYEFALINDPVLGSEAVAANFLQSDAFSGSGATQLAIDSPASGNWTLTAAPVPVPAALPLLASALGALRVFGLGRRRSVAN